MIDNEDDEILKTVRSMLGTNAEIVECEKTSTVHEEEVLLINGVPIKLDCEKGAAVKKALITGEMPPCDLLNEILFQAGVLQRPVQLETSLSVKSSQITKEEVIVARDGRIVNERSTETTEDNVYTSSCQEVWELVSPTLPGSPVSDRLTTNISREGSDIRNTASTTATHEMPTMNFAPAFLNNLNNNDQSNSESGLKGFCYSSINSSNSSVKSSTSSTSLPSSKQKSLTRDQNHRHHHQNHNHHHLPEVTTTNDNESKYVITKNSSLSKTLQSITCDSGHQDDDDEYYDNAHRTPNSMSSNGCYNFSDEEVFDQEEDSCELANRLVYIRPQHRSQSAAISDNTIFFDASIDSDTHGADARESNNKKSPVTANNDNLLVYRDGALTSGTLSALIEHMVPTATYYPEQSYLFAFLLSSRLFITPNNLLARVCEICERQQLLKAKLVSSSDINQRSDVKRSAHQIVQLLQEWMNTFPYDFRDNRLLKQAQKTLHLCTSLDRTLVSRTSAMQQLLAQRLNALEKYEEECTGVKSKYINNDFTDQYNQTDSSGCPIHNSSSNNGTANSSTIDIMELCSTPTQLAHHLTHIELECLSHIGPEEFVQAFAKENSNHLVGLHGEKSYRDCRRSDCNTLSSGSADSKESRVIDGSSPKPKNVGTDRAETVLNTDVSSGSSSFSNDDVKKPRNLEVYIQWFNRLSYLVASEVVKHPKKKQRVRLVEYWIETGRECFNIGNFNSLMAIIAGLNMAPISRLKKTWLKVQTAKFSVLEHQMDPTSNFISYRSTLKAAMWRSAGATDDLQRIVIPFFSLLVKDLYFLNEGCSNKLSNGHINFDKFWQVAKQVTEFIAWKQVQCPFDRSANIIQFLQKRLICLSENALALASFDCEPPDNAHEKERYKVLKNEHHQLNHHDIPKKH